MATTRRLPSGAGAVTRSWDGRYKYDVYRGSEAAIELRIEDIVELVILADPVVIRALVEQAQAEGRDA